MTSMRIILNKNNNNKEMRSFNFCSCIVKHKEMCFSANSSVIIEISSGNLHDLQVAHQRIHPGSCASVVDDHCSTEHTFQRVCNLEDKNKKNATELCGAVLSCESGRFFALNVAGSQLCFHRSHKNHLLSLLAVTGAQSQRALPVPLTSNPVYKRTNEATEQKRLLVRLAGFMTQSRSEKTSLA